MTLRQLLLAGVAAAVILAGCSGPAPQPAAAPSAVATTAAPPAPSAALPSPESAAPLQYVALGDSLASGMGGEPSYADVYRRGLRRATGHAVQLNNLGRPGWTSAQLLDALRSDGTFRSAVEQADVITLDIGGNDIVQAVIRHSTGTCGGDDDLQCMRETTEHFADNWAAIIDELVALRRDEAVPVRTFDLYSPFIFPDARTDPVMAQLDDMNAIIRDSHAQDGVAVAAVADAFAGAPEPLLDDDGLHPSPAGHRLIARLLLELDAPPS